MGYQFNCKIAGQIDKGPTNQSADDIVDMVYMIGRHVDAGEVRASCRGSGQRLSGVLEDQFIALFASQWGMGVEIAAG